MHRHIDAAIAELAATQRSAFSVRQARSIGADQRLINRRVRSGAWLWHTEGVLGLPGSHDCFERTLWVAHLAAGPQSVISHEPVGAIYGVPGFPPGQAVVTVPHPVHPRIEGITIHQISDLLGRTPDLVVNGREIPGFGEPLPITGPARLIVDLAATTSPARLRFALDHVVHHRLTTYAAVGECLCRVARRGKPGVRLLTALLDARENEHGTTSECERLLYRIAGPPEFPPLDRQAPLPGRGIDGICDGTWDDTMLVLEGDSRSWHARIDDIKRDRERDAQAARAGYQTLRFLYEHLSGDPDGVRATLRDVRATRLRQLRSI